MKTLQISVFRVCIPAAVLHFQLKEIPEDFFVDIVSRDNFLTSTLHVSYTHNPHVNAWSIVNY